MIGFAHLPVAVLYVGGLSGPWPPSLSVIRRLRYLTEVYQ